MSLEIIEQIPASEDNIKKVIEVVSSVTGVREQSITSKSRLRDYVFARNMCYSVMRHGLGMTFMSIGSYFDKHHATILYAVKVNDKDVEASVAYRTRFETILGRLGVRFAEQVSHGDVINHIANNMYRREPIVID